MRCRYLNDQFSVLFRQEMDVVSQTIMRIEVARKRYDDIGGQKRRLEVELDMMQGQKLQLADKITEVTFLVLS